MNKENRNIRNNKGILGKYGLIVTLLMLFSIMIIFSAGKIVFSSEGKKWKEVGEKETVIRDRVILPKRGNIYTHDYKLLVFHRAIYSIYMDFWADGIKKGYTYEICWRSFDFTCREISR